MRKIVLILAIAVPALPLCSQELVTFGGYHTQLHGYTDERYIGEDKGDYLKTSAWYAGVDFLQRKIISDVPELAGLVLGASSNLYVQNSFRSRSLYAVSSPSIPAETILGDAADRTGKFQLTLSGFGGIEEEWWGLQAGLSVFLKGSNEQTREKYDSGGGTIEVDGRGWVFDNSLILPNFLFRIGPTSIPHVSLSLFRGHYDPGYGALVGQVVIPLRGFGSLSVGGSLYQTASIFVEPSMTLGGVDVGVRAGTILNYYDKSFTRVGIFEGAFVAGSMAFRW